MMRMYGDPNFFIKQPETETVYVSGQTDAQFFYNKMCIAEEKCKQLEKKLEAIKKSDVGKLKDAVWDLSELVCEMKVAFDDIKYRVYDLKGRDKYIVLTRFESLQHMVASRLETIGKNLEGVDTTK